MDEAYKLTEKLLREKLQKEDKANTKILDEIKETDIIVVEGTYDHIHNVLTSMRIPFTKVTQNELLSIRLSPDQIVYVNCPSSFISEAAFKLAEFVHSGGLLVSTDWALRHVIMVAFPGTIKWNGRTTSDEVISIDVIDPTDDIVKGIIHDPDAKPQWWLETSSYPISIISPEITAVLVKSDELKRKYGEEAVIVRVQWGKGFFYHMISHFYLQRTEAKHDKHKTFAKDFAAETGASPETLSELKNSKVVYGSLQSAYTSSEVVSRTIIKQKKIVEERSKERNEKEEL
eukprot:TRINITY_DN6265_c0_g1_i1.p1 TRINITY_DN6265_c0_g1~~TRINITY_DN6265_c0_g1_i1.p1  ORF type:complete len:313 (+),score=53.81 TRINITY_DN6265_c0_g1_i1:78-941(+)